MKMSKLSDKYLITKKILPVLDYGDIDTMTKLKQATHITANMILAEIKELDPRFNLLQLYSDTLKYNRLKDSLSGKIRKYIRLLELNTNRIYLEIDSNNRSKAVFDLVKKLLSMFTLVGEYSYSLRYEYSQEWDQIYNDIRWLELYEARYHMDKPLQNNGNMNIGMWDLM